MLLLDVLNDPISWSTLFTSTLLATLLSSLITVLIKSKEHKYFYKKHILEKRIEVYNKVEELFKTLETVVKFDDKSNVIRYHAIFDGDDGSNYYIFKNEMELLLNKSFWLSDSIFQILKRLYNILTIVSYNPLKINKDYLLAEA